MTKGQVVYVYYNFRKKMWSVRDVKTRKVIGHTDHITLLNPTFKVSKAGRARVLYEGRKNVHAGVQGTILTELFQHFTQHADVRYNPYELINFVSTETGMLPTFAEDCSTTKTNAWKCEAVVLQANRMVTAWA